MAQVGVIVISENVNTQAFINLLKQDPKLTIGNTMVSKDGTKYISIDKNGWFMSGWLIALSGLIYAYVAAEQCYKGNWGMFIAYTGYAYANIGLYILASK